MLYTLWPKTVRDAVASLGVRPPKDPRATCVRFAGARIGYAPRSRVTLYRVKVGWRIRLRTRSDRPQRDMPLGDDADTVQRLCPRRE